MRRYNAHEVWVGSHRQRGGKSARVPSGRALYRLPRDFSQSLLPPLLPPPSTAARYPDVSLKILCPQSVVRRVTSQRELRRRERFMPPAGTARTELLTLNEVCVLPCDHPLAAKTGCQTIFRENFVSLPHRRLSTVVGYGPAEASGEAQNGGGNAWRDSSRDGALTGGGRF